MRLTFVMEGGLAHFPGLSRPFVIDTETLPDDERHEIEQLVEAARFLNLPQVVGTPKRGAADYLQYTLTVEVGGRRHAVRLVDPVEDPHLQSLVGYLKKRQVKTLREGGG